MNSKSYLSSNTPLLSTCMILLLFAFFFSKVLFVGHLFLQTSDTLPTWQQQQWLKHPDGSEVLYVRKSFNLDTQPVWAFITVSAIDEFIVYLNGQPVGEKILPSETPAATYDVTPILKLGNNTLAIRSMSQQKHLNAQTIAKLNWRALGKNNTLSSNRSWRVDNKESFQGHGRIAWFQNDYNDHEWASAISSIDPVARQSSPIPIPSNELLKLRPKNWVWVNHLNLSRINISQMFTLNTDHISSAWLAISTDGSYQITLNGLAFPTRSERQEKMEYFSIAPYLQKGENKINLQFQSAENRLDKIALSGLITTKNKQIDFAISPKWNCETKPCRYTTFALGQYTPILKAIELTEPLQYTLMQGYQQFIWLFFILITSLLPARWLIPLLTAHNKYSWQQACLIYSQPYGLVTLLLVTLLIINADSRFDLQPYYAGIIPLIVVIIIALFIVQLGVECKQLNNAHLKKD